MYNYIQNGNKYFNLTEPLGEGYDISEVGTFEDFLSGKIILLSERQNAFLFDNPEASTLEIFNCQLQEIQEPSEETLVSFAKMAKIQELEAYDKSTNVNEFYVDGKSMWLDNYTRVSLSYTLVILENTGKTSTTLWTQGTNPVSLYLPIEVIRSILSEVELYAKECYDVTAQHKSNINHLSSVESIENYDYKCNYPEKLSYSTN